MIKIFIKAFIEEFKRSHSISEAYIAGRYSVWLLKVSKEIKK